MSSIQRLDNLIGGEWAPAGSGETFESVSPATGETLATFPRSGEAEVERAVAAAFDRLKPGRPPLQPNVEINAALLLDAVGLPRDAFTPVFAVGRCPGWLAHAMEQQHAGRMIRPSSAYIGPVPPGESGPGRDA